MGGGRGRGGRGKGRAVRGGSRTAGGAGSIGCWLLRVSLDMQDIKLCWGQNHLRKVEHAVAFGEVHPAIDIPSQPNGGWHQLEHAAELLGRVCMGDVQVEPSVSLSETSLVSAHDAGILGTKGSHH